MGPATADVPHLALLSPVVAVVAVVGALCTRAVAGSNPAAPTVLTRAYPDCMIGFRRFVVWFVLRDVTCTT